VREGAAGEREATRRVVLVNGDGRVLGATTALHADRGAGPSGVSRSPRPDSLRRTHAPPRARSTAELAIL
ncbi:hypothetical protein C5C59_15625, partial [Rathayibacter sp. AY1F4]